MDEALTVAEAAKALSLKVAQAYVLIRENRFPCKVIRIGNQYRIPRAALEELLGVNHGEN